MKKRVPVADAPTPSQEPLPSDLLIPHTLDVPEKGLASERKIQQLKKPEHLPGSKFGKARPHIDPWTPNSLLEGNVARVQMRSAASPIQASIDVELLYTTGATRIIDYRSSKVVDQSLQSSWRDGVSKGIQIRAESVYPGVDMAFHQRRGVYDFEYQLAPGTDPSVIVFGVPGAAGPELGVEGEVILTDIGSGQELKLDRPYVYQWDDGVRKRLDGEYVLNGVEIPYKIESYDQSKPLHID